MTNIKNNKSPDALYREYQNQRDDIPSGIYHNLVSKASEVRHEKSIHSLLQQAKIKLNETEEQKVIPNSPKKLSIVAKVKEFFSTSPSKAWGTAFASTAFAIFAIPLLMNSSLTNNSEATYNNVAHLSNCADCGSYINDASLMTRSALLGSNQVTPSAKIAARLGRQSGNLKIAATLDSQIITDNALAELKKINETISDKTLETILNSNTLEISALISAIKDNQHSINNTSVFKTAESLHIASITARSAIETGDMKHANTTRHDAISHYQTIQDRTVLQDNLLKQLTNVQTSSIDSLIKLYTQALQSLGI